MSRITLWISVAVVISGSLASTIPALAGNRSPDAILKEIDAVNIKLPKVDLSRVEDKSYIRQFMKQRSEIRVRRAELIGALYQIDPGNPRLVALLPVRWRSFSGRLGGPDDNAGARDLTGELSEVFAQSKNEKLKIEAAYIKAWIVSDPFNRMGAAKNNAAKAKAVDEFIAFAPKDHRGAELLDLLSIAFKDEPARQKALYARIVQEYPQSKEAKIAQGILRRLVAAGKTFDLTFHDVITGTKISMQSLRGKIVIVDFWATWCGPCVAEMPRLKALYAKYHDKGVAFIGVSLDFPKDEGGLGKLKAFIAKNEIPWPQFYQGSGWESDFSRGFGIDAIPTVFVVDQTGKLVSVNAGGDLETLIIQLMNRSATKDAGVDS